MKVLNARVINHINKPMLYVLVEECIYALTTDVDEPFYRLPKHPKIPEQQGYFRLFDDCLTFFVHDSNDEHGYGGATFEMAVFNHQTNQVDIVPIKGPWSTGPWDYNKVCYKFSGGRFGAVTVLMTTNKKEYHNQLKPGESGVAFQASVTSTFAQQALDLIQSPHRHQLKYMPEIAEFILTPKDKEDPQ